MNKKFIGFDLGAESGRCVVAELDGEKIRLNEVHRFPTHSIKFEYGFHWDILAIYNEIITGLSNARKNFGPQFNGIAIDSWAVDYVLTDRNGRVLGYPYHYRDSRTDGIMEQAFRIIPKNELYNKTGIQFAQFNTMYQFLAEKERNPNLLNFADKFLLIPDFFNFLLSGKKKAEFTNASTTGLTDPHKRNWSWELIEMFGLPRKIFPEIAEPGTVLGPLLLSIANAAGLNDNIPVIAGASHDTASAVASVPANTDDDWAFLSSGTWSLMGVELKRPLISDEAMNYNFTNEGGVENTVRFLKNIIGLWPVQECRRYWGEHSEEVEYNELVSKAGENGFTGSWVNLNDPRFLKSGDMPEKITDFLKETGQAFKPEKGFIIILESLAFSYRQALDQIEEVAGKKIKNLYAVGGGIRNELLTQLTADAIDRNVIAGPVEGTIAGNIGVQAAATGAVSGLREWRKIVSNSFEQKIYKPANPGYFKGNEEKYKNILKYKVNG